MGEFLSGEGYQVMEADSGQAALAKSAEQNIDLLVTEVKMPEMSGIELASEMRKAIPGLPVLFMSGFTDGMLNLEDGSGFLRKPFRFSDLSAQLRTLQVPQSDKTIKV